MARVKVVTMFLLAWVCAAIVWNTFIRAYSIRNPDSKIVKGLVTSGTA